MRASSLPVRASTRVLGELPFLPLTTFWSKFCLLSRVCELQGAQSFSSSSLNGGKEVRASVSLTPDRRTSLSTGPEHPHSGRCMGKSTLLVYMRPLLVIICTVFVIWVSWTTGARDWHTEDSNGCHHKERRQDSKSHHTPNSTEPRFQTTIL